MKKIRIVSLVLAVAMLVSITAFAEDSLAEDAPTLVATDIVLVDGINYVERTYILDGKTIKTLSIDESLSTNIDSKSIKESLLNYMASDELTSSAISVVSPGEIASPTTNYPNHESDFSNSTASTRNSNCCVGHNGSFYSGTASLFDDFMGVTGGRP